MQVIQYKDKFLEKLSKNFKTRPLRTHYKLTFLVFFSCKILKLDEKSFFLNLPAPFENFGPNTLYMSRTLIITHTEIYDFPIILKRKNKLFRLDADSLLPTTINSLLYFHFKPLQKKICSTSTPILFYVFIAALSDFLPRPLY